MKDSTLIILLFFVLAYSALCFYWIYQFYGPPAQAAEKYYRELYPPIKSKDAFIRRNAIKYQNSTDDDEGPVKDIIFPPDRTPIDELPTKGTWYEDIKNFKKPEIDFDKMHFVHVPKCGGSTMSSILRKIMCDRNPVENAECCVPGICHRRTPCKSISGCYDHYPNRFVDSVWCCLPQ